MALVPVGNKALIAAGKSSDEAVVKKPSINVLDEDEYMESLEKIITKDFFPDLPKLQAQAEYLDALERKDVQKIWQLQQKFSQKRVALRTPSIYGTPSTFDTPDTRISSTPARETEKGEDGQETLQEDGPTHNPELDAVKSKLLSKTSLDKFLAKNTSEDNLSFGEIMKEAEQKQRLKHSWLYEQVTEQLEERERSLALPSLEQQAIEPAVSGVNTWTYVLKNSVMYVPDGVAATAEETILKAGKGREIVHRNTRLAHNPFNTDRNKECLTQAASALAKVQPGRIGPDGKEILPAQSPKVGGHGFVATPSPAPGVDASPLMTWGEIEGTPFRLDGSDSPFIGSTRGPMFKIPEVPRRDRLLHELAEKTSKAHRDKKEKALKQATASFSSPSPKFHTSKTDRLQFLSPAAQSLASKKLGIRVNSDKALQASYTPSPIANRTPGDKTPTLATPSPGTSSVRSTRKAATPTSSSNASATTPSRASKHTMTSLTDNLLNLPKRPKAHEFF